MVWNREKARDAAAGERVVEVDRRKDVWQSVKRDSFFFSKTILLAFASG